MKYIGILVVISVLYDFVRVIIRNNVIKKASQFLIESRYDEFDALMESKKARFFIPKYNHYTMLLSKEMKVGSDKVFDIVKQINQLKTTKKQKEFVFIRAFYYFLNKDHDKAKKIYRKLKEITGSEEITAEDIAYDIYINESTKYLSSVQSSFDNSEDMSVKIQNASYLSKMYELTGDIEKKNYYAQFVKQGISPKKDSH